MVERHSSHHSLTLRTASALAVALALAAAGTPSRASGPEEPTIDASALAQMELRADQAKPLEQCYLYTEVLHDLTESAGRAMAAGDEAKVSTTMARIDAVMHKLETASAAKAKRLKNAEELMEHTQHRLADMARVASAGEHDVVQSTLQHMDKVHTSLLALVFAK